MVLNDRQIERQKLKEDFLKNKKNHKEIKVEILAPKLIESDEPITRKGGQAFTVDLN